MKDLVREDPAKAVAKAIHQTRVEAAMEYGEHEMFYENIIAELGNEKALEQMLYEVTIESVGIMPKSRTDFNPSAFHNGMTGD